MKITVRTLQNAEQCNATEFINESFKENNMTQIAVSMPKTKTRKKTMAFPLIYKGVFLFTAFAIVIWLFSTLFLRSYNINLSM